MPILLECPGKNAIRRRQFLSLITMQRTQNTQNSIVTM